MQAGNHANNDSMLVLPGDAAMTSAGWTRREFEAQTAPKIETLNRHLNALDKRIPLRRVPPVSDSKHDDKGMDDDI